MELESPVQIPDRMFFKIGEVASIASVKPYVLRYWESEFAILSPSRGGAFRGGNNQQRVYSRTDVENVLLIKHLLYDLRFSIEGAKKRISEMRKQGELTEARKVRISVDADKFSAIKQAKQELKELIDICKLSQ